jgi:hypothetical protein
MRTIGLGVIAAGAISLGLADAAGAVSPEFGTCIKFPKLGKFHDAECTEEQTEGDFEWNPGFPIQKQFTTKIKPETKATLETVKKVAITCSNERSTGEYTGLKAVGNVQMIFAGCETAFLPCKSAGAEEREVQTSVLQGVLNVWKLGIVPKKDLLGISLAPPAPQLFAEFVCGGILTVKVRGTVIVPVTANKMLLETELKFEAAKGQQKPSRFLGAPFPEVLEVSVNGGIYEQAGLTLTTRLTNPEKVEANSVV